MNRYFFTIFFNLIFIVIKVIKKDTFFIKYCFNMTYYTVGNTTFHYFIMIFSFLIDCLQDFQFTYIF
jgi:hypothetical protein